MVRELTVSCLDCGITGDIIDMQSFSCFPDSPSHVTYRARLQGTSETDSGSLISLIEDWVDDGATIVVIGLLMKVDSKCSVEISSFNEGECLEIRNSTPPPKMIVDSTPRLNAGPTDSANNTISPGAIIGGIVAVLVILIIAISLIIVVVLILKYRRGDPKNTK